MSDLHNNNGDIINGNDPIPSLQLEHDFPQPEVKPPEADNINILPFALRGFHRHINPTTRLKESIEYLNHSIANNVEADN